MTTCRWCGKPLYALLRSRQYHAPCQAQKRDAATKAKRITAAINRWARYHQAQRRRGEAA